MTREEAKKRLEVRLICAKCPEDKMCYDSYLHSICEYTDYCDEVPIEEAVKVAIEALEQEPCEDAVSRQAVLDCQHFIYDETGEELEVILAENVLNLPSVTQKSETVTEFADRCRECGAKYGKLLKQEPCKDAISRQELLNDIDTAIKATNMDDPYSVGMRNGMRLIKAFIDDEKKCCHEENESEISQQKMGHWIRVDKDKLRCSECEVIHLIAQYPNGKVDWCPNCGAKMAESEEKE